MANDPRTAWLIILTHLAASLLALIAWQSAERRRDGVFWLSAAMVLLLLGLNKQLDLQTGLTAFLRELAKSEGWYDARREAQGVFLLLLGAGTAIIAVAVAIWLRGAPSSVKVAAAGLLMLAAFVFVRAASFHHVDQWLIFDLAGIRGGRWLELIGSGTVTAAAASFRWFRAAGAPPAREPHCADDR